MLIYHKILLVTAVLMALPVVANTKIKANLHMNKITAPWTADGAVIGKAFKIYLETQSVPTLSKGDISTEEFSHNELTQDQVSRPPL